MPLPFNPARMAARARGLRVIQGGGASARARALARAARQGGRAPETLRAAEREGAPRAVALDVYGPEGYEKTVKRAPAARFSREATEAMHREAAQRHAGVQPTEDPRSWFFETSEDVLQQLRDFAAKEPTWEPAPIPDKPTRNPLTGKLVTPDELRAQRKTARKDFALWDPDKGPPPGMTAEQWARARAEALRSRGAKPEPEPEGPHSRVPDATSRELYPGLYGRGEVPLLDAFEQRYGWRPPSEDAARAMLTPEQLAELGFPEG